MWKRTLTRCAIGAVAALALAGGARIASAQAQGLPVIDSPEKAKAAQKECSDKLGKPVEWTNTIGMKFQLIPAGEFIMGSATGEADETPHRVRLTQPFYMGTTEVTRAQWQGLMKNVYNTIFPGPDMPMNYISWYEANDFINALNKAEKVKYRVPTEAEWEYAARAGVSTRYSTGDDEKALDKAGWYDMNSGETTHPVAQKAANAFGLYDMSGNVWEWCSDFYDKDYYKLSPVDNPTGPKLSLYGYRVIRGGSIFYSANSCRLTHRDYYQDSRSDKHFGFRIMLPIEAAATVIPAPAPAAGK